MNSSIISRKRTRQDGFWENYVNSLQTHPRFGKNEAAVSRNDDNKKISDSSSAVDVAMADPQVKIEPPLLKTSDGDSRSFGMDYAYVMAMKNSFKYLLLRPNNYIYSAEFKNKIGGGSAKNQSINAYALYTIVKRRMFALYKSDYYKNKYYGLISSAEEWKERNQRIIQSASSHSSSRGNYPVSGYEFKPSYSTLFKITFPSQKEEHIYIELCILACLCELLKDDPHIVDRFVRLLEWRIKATLLLDYVPSHRYIDEKTNRLEEKNREAFLNVNQMSPMIKSGCAQCITKKRQVQINNSAAAAGNEGMYITTLQRHPDLLFSESQSDIFCDSHHISLYECLNIHRDFISNTITKIRRRSKPILPSGSAAGSIENPPFYQSAVFKQNRGGVNGSGNSCAAIEKEAKFISALRGTCLLQSIVESLQKEANKLINKHAHH